MNAQLRSCAALCLLLPACANLNLYSEEDEQKLGAQAYVEETGKYKTITGTADAQMVQRVGQKIAAASGQNYQWEFKLLDAHDVVNAFCLPGGKVAVYSGILPVTQNEDALAIVLGHEVAHATQRHGGKRMTQNDLTNTALGLVAQGLSLGQMSSAMQQGVMAALGVGAQVGVALPYSRSQETEADEVGLRYAIRAGYDPYEAPKLWDRMSKLGSAGPTWLSDHPDPGQRAENLKAKIPQYLAEERKQAPAPQQPARH